MPKYLWTASYSPQGAEGVIQKGGSARRAAIEQLVKGAGGTLEAFYFAFGDADVVVIADLPSETTATAISMAVNATGLVALKTVPLLEPEQVDEAAKQTVDYRPPGS
ncbi:MAG TPA: GYD domain-containing protein [Solirubrobacteraceae bacterium]|jgi:uncharacterized protein with GYD domain|nr:GYD domain-containing protein [Solirubrobacteraceae bacterium]